MDKSVRSLKTWDMTQALVDALALRLSSFREIEEAVGIPRSTFGDALSTRFPGFFQDLSDLVLNQIRSQTKNRKTRRAIREILAIDSTDCTVNGGIFSLPGWQTRRAEGGQAACKLHVVFNVEGEWIDDFKITGVRRHDSPVSMELRILPGKTYVFDRAYSDLAFWLKIMASGSHFVTRLKECSRIRKFLAEILSKVGDKDGVLWDGLYVPSPIQFNRHRESLKESQIRHIIYRDPETKKIFHFVTSDRRASAQLIAKIYRRRWAVELLFRWLKSNLDIRYLAVKNANSVKIQLAVAVLIQLLLQLKKIMMNYQGTLWALLRSLRTAQTRHFLASQRYLLPERQYSATRATIKLSIK
jgi:hypothetical protein